MKLALQIEASAVDRTAVEFMALIALGKVSEETANRFIDAMGQGHGLFEAISEPGEAGVIVMRAAPSPVLKRFLDACDRQDADAVDASLAEIEALQ